MFKLAIGLGLVLVLPGCFSTISVEKWNPDSPDGLPFFAKVGRLKQKTVLARAWVDVTLSVLHESAAGVRSKPLTMRIAIPESAWTPDATARALASATFATAKVSPTPSEIPEALRLATAAFTDSEAAGLPALDPLALFHAARPQPLPAGSAISEHVLSNEVAVVAEADYSNPLAFNVRSPIFGSASGALEVAGDGTLSKASSSLDTSKLADVIPLKDYLTAALGLAPAELVSAKAGDRFVVLVDARIDGVKFTLTRTSSVPGKPASGDEKQQADPSGELALKRPPLSFDDAHSVTRSALNAPSQEGGDDKIQFSGSVALPKS